MPTATISYPLSRFLPPDCSCRLEDRAAELPGVLSVSLQPVHGRVTVEHDPAITDGEQLRDQLIATGCPCEDADESTGHIHHAHADHADHTAHAPATAEIDPASHDQHADHAEADSPEHHNHHAMMQADMKRRVKVVAVLAVPLLILSPTIQDWFRLDIPAFSGDRYLLFALATAVTAYGGWPFLIGAARALRRGVLDMDVLVAVGSGYLFSVAATFWFPAVDFYWEIATLLGVLLLGHWQEMRAICSATSALNELGNLLPDIAHRLSGDRIEDVPTSSLAPGDLIQIRPGESLPIDGEIIEGATEIDESMLTGESRPVVRSAGDTVIAEVLPADKADRIAELQRDGSRVAMVGDGVNDAPALSRADLGIAIESAGAVLMRDDPRDVVRLIKLSTATTGKMFQNLA